MRIIGNTVGSTLPKPNLMQTDPNKGDYVKGKEKIPTKVSQLENDAGFLTEHQDISHKLDTSKMQEIINGLNILTNNDINMLDTLLTTGSFGCNPSIGVTAVRTKNGNQYTWEISARIYFIDKRLIRKVEIGRVLGAGYENYNYEWNSCAVTYGDGSHEAVKTFTHMSPSYFPTGLAAVRLTYYATFGVEETLIVKAVVENA